MESPFQDQPVERWEDIRNNLIEKHPLSLDEIRDLVLNSWEKLLQTRIGPPYDDILVFRDVDLPAQVVSNFLEVILSRELNKIDDRWRRGSSSEKDLIFEPDEFFSTEMKCSGQGGVKVFGNRSYAQEVETGFEKKEKSGYYITINFFNDLLYLIRFGWIDYDDWKPQKAATGQAATLPNEIYDHKLSIIKGEYQLNAPIITLDRIGPKTIDNMYKFMPKEIRTIRQLLEYCETEKGKNAIKKSNDLERAFTKARISLRQIEQSKLKDFR